jgi:hypothetical protein
MLFSLISGHFSGLLFPSLHSEVHRSWICIRELKGELCILGWVNQILLLPEAQPPTSKRAGPSL